ncbi:MAG: 1,4-dihydroxy-2-naphthoate polyprenyltransferase [Dysgonamonadaceae bacterium]|jgi:1,4-dihydroxy-2-naphthoate octaprenyltransferase|nr:1,4-dihydroxy-2-naphthoate polyprenyltransferase [Dysgonamonadaceae bacterium]
MVKPDSLKAWLLAARPKTLSASATPVVAASALAFHDGGFRWIPALLCLVFALLAQVVSNFANDYFDYRKGADDAERLGPKRAVAEGWILPSAMLRATLVLLAIDLIIGLLLLPYGGWPLVFVGLAVAVFALAYSGGPYPLAYHGWGDVCVLIFFGIVPVGFTYFLQTGHWTFSALICGLACGLAIINILVANNFRDRTLDEKANKRTSIVIFGERFGSLFYLFNGIAASACCLVFIAGKAWLAAFLPMIYLVFHIATWMEMKRIWQGKALIAVLEKTARNVLIFGLTLAAGLIL